MGTCLSTTTAKTTTTTTTPSKSNATAGTAVVDDGSGSGTLLLGVGGVGGTDADPSQKSTASTSTSSSSPAAHKAAAAAAAATTQEPQQQQHPIMGQIEKLQQESGRPFGRLLDAGTGLNSLSWIAHLLQQNEDQKKKKSTTTEDAEDATEEGASSQRQRLGLCKDSWTAVTASPTMFHEISIEAQKLGITHPEQHFVAGNWFHDDEGDEDDEDQDSKMLLQGEVYDTILVDYVIGAMDAFSPYRQDCFLERLIHEHLNPDGGRLYLIGTEPIPEKPPRNDHDDSGGGGGENKSLVCRVNNMRDACIKLAGQRCYREYPLEWTLRNIKRVSQSWNSTQRSDEGAASSSSSSSTTKLKVVHVSKFNLLHSYDDIHDQLGVARSMLKHIHDGSLCGSLEESIDKLNMEAKRTFHVVPPKSRRHYYHNNHHRTPTTPSPTIHFGFDYLVVVESTPDKQEETD